MQESALSAAINNQLEQHVLISQFMTKALQHYDYYLSDYASLLASSPSNLRKEEGSLSVL